MDENNERSSASEEITHEDEPQSSHERDVTAISSQEIADAVLSDNPESSPESMEEGSESSDIESETESRHNDNLSDAENRR